MRHRQLPAVAAFVLALSACASLENSPGGHHGSLQTLYDSQVIRPSDGQVLSLAELAGHLETADVIFVGEFHGHNGAHLLQSRLQVALHQRRPGQILSLEPFNVDQQAILDRYLAEEIGEQALIEQTDAWPNYRASYRPLVEFARHHRLPVIAANAPADLVRCVGREGAGYLESLAPEVARWLPDQPLFTTPPYRDRFLAAMGHGGHGSHGDQGQQALERQFQAQLLRDNTMAASILEALRRHPEQQVLHITGSFHSEDRLGTVAALLHRAPDLRVRVLTPVIGDDAAGVSRDEAASGDYLYRLLPLPPEFRDPDRRRQAMRERFARAPEVRCTPERPVPLAREPKT